MKSLITILLGTATLAGCVSTGFQPYGGTGGYTEEKIADGTFRLSYLVNANTPAQKALEFWHRRAAELCGSSAYVSDVKLTTKDNSSFAFVPNSGAYYSKSVWPLAIGTVQCGKQAGA